MSKPRFKISPSRVGVNYDSEYRHSLEGARRVAAKQLQDVSLPADVVVISDRGAATDRRVKCVIWKFYEAWWLSQETPVLLTKQQLEIDHIKALVRRAK